jgi:hypothetical protein
VKLGLRGRTQNTKDLEFRKGSRVGELRRKNAIELSLKKFIQSKNEMKLGFGGRI